MMSSAKGPGVIGLILALLIVAGFGVLLLFTTDERFLGGGPTIDSVIADQQKDIDKLELLLADMKRRTEVQPALLEAAKDLERSRRDKLFATDMLAGHRGTIVKVKEEIEAKAAEIEAYKDKYRAQVRAKAKGTAIGRLETRDGTVYEQVTVREVNAVGMQISHDGGGRRIPFEQLPDEMQDFYQFDPGQKKRLLALEKAGQDAHEASVDTTLAAVKEQAGRKREADAARRRDEAIAAIGVKEARIKALELEIRDFEESINRESQKRISNAPQMRERLAKMRQVLSALREDVDRLRSSL